MNRFFRSALFPLIVIVLLVYLVSQAVMGGEQQQKLTYSQLQQRVESEPQTIKQIVANPNKQELSVEFRPRGGEEPQKTKVAYPSPESLRYFEGRLRANNVTF